MAAVTPDSTPTAQGNVTGTVLVFPDEPRQQVCFINKIACRLKAKHLLDGEDDAPPARSHPPTFLEPPSPSPAVLHRVRARLRRQDRAAGVTLERRVRISAPPPASWVAVNRARALPGPAARLLWAHHARARPEVVFSSAYPLCVLKFKHIRWFLFTAPKIS